MDKKTWNILLADDEVEFVTTLAERLELRGITTRVAYDGKSALQEVVKHVPQAVVLDVMMPGISGLETLQRIREEHPKLPVILLTGQGRTRDGIEGMQLGASAYLMKPLDLQELMRTLEEAITGQSGATS